MKKLLFSSFLLGLSPFVFGDSPTTPDKTADHAADAPKKDNALKLEGDLLKKHAEFLEKNKELTGGNGLSPESAIIIHAKDSKKGVALESKYIDYVYGSSIARNQGLLQIAGKMYDCIIFSYKGKLTKVYFNIDSFFGKFDEED